MDERVCITNEKAFIIHTDLLIGLLFRYLEVSLRLLELMPEKALSAIRLAEENLTAG